MKFFIPHINFYILTSGIFILNISKFVGSQNCEAPRISHDFGNFDNEFFQLVLKDGKANVKMDLNEDNFSLVVSPFYLKSLLSIISLGTNNSSLEELNGVLNIQSCKKIQHDFFQSALKDRKGNIKKFSLVVTSFYLKELLLITIKELNGIFNIQRCERDQAKMISQQMAYGVWDNDTKIDAFHKLFISRNIHLKPSFKSLLAHFNVTIDEINYEDESEAQIQINKLIADRSKTFIGEMFNFDDVLKAKNNPAIFSNAYFKANWLTPPTVLNGIRDFYVNENETTKMRMFRITQEMRYSNIEEIDAQVVDIPYKNCNLSMMIFVPNSRDGLNHLEEKLLIHNNLLDYVDKFLEYKPVAATLPKYSLESVILLPKKLEKLGITKIFSEGADLDLIKNGGNAYISHAIQRVMVWVTEGRNAFKDTGDPEYPIPEKFVVADRPYFFLIKSNKNIIFMGHFYK